MKSNNNTMRYGIFLLGFVITVSTVMTAQAGENDYALLIQSSPPDGGTVTPGAGVHQMQIGQTVNLSAKPKKGYRFMYWLGDVSKTSGVNTTVSINSPKLVVAVFSRERFGEELPGTGVIDGRGFFGGGGGRFINPVRNPASVNPGAGPIGFVPFTFEPPVFPGIPDIPNIPEPPVDENNDIPVPGENDDIPVPGDGEVPEPATLILLGLGGLILRNRKR